MGIQQNWENFLKINKALYILCKLNKFQLKLISFTESCKQLSLLNLFNSI